MKPRIFAIAAMTAMVCALAGAQAQTPAHSVWDGVYTAAQADKGKALFEDNCTKCHGGTLDGNDEIPALKGSHFMSDWETQSASDLITRVRTTMPMDNPGKLNAESATAVVAYLLQQNGMPAGTAGLDDANNGAIITTEKPAR